MTTIAWDGKTLAADRLRTVGNTPMGATKLFRVEAPFYSGGLKGGILFGACGDSWDCAAFRLWVEGGNPPTPKNLGVVAIDARGVCWYGGETLIFHEVELPYWACGSGADYALGAMAAGKPAREAVEIASGLDVHTGLGVDVLEL